MLLDQLYKPTLKINKINYFLRFISIFIIKIFFLDKIKIFSNCFQQQLNTYLVMNYNKKKIFLKMVTRGYIGDTKRSFKKKINFANG
jgi:hypothetical protein